MNSKFSDCPHGASCKWEKKYHQKEKEFKKLESKVDQDVSFYNDKFNSQAREIMERDKLIQYKRNKLQKKKKKILSLKQLLKEKDKEIKDICTDLEITKGKLSRLVKYRHQSVDQINELEAEIEKSRRLLQTPPVVRVKKDIKSMQSTLELNLGIFPFEIQEFTKHKQAELEKIIENDSRLLRDERIKVRELSYKVELLIEENSSLNRKVENIQSQFLNCQNKAGEEKEKMIEKINQLKNEKMDLAYKLKEYRDKESVVNTSDIDCFNLKDELSKLEISNKSKLFDLNNSINFCEGQSRTHTNNSYQQAESQKLIEMLELNLRNAMDENERLKDEIIKKKKYARELNKVLRENNAAFENFRRKFSFQAVDDEVKMLIVEKGKIERLVEVRKKELENLNEMINERNWVKEKVMLENVIEKSNEESFRNNIITLINKNRKFPEDTRRRRNINSWSHNFFNQECLIKE